MVADQATQSIEFSGSANLQKLAAEAFNVLRTRGMFMSNNAPIRVPLVQLTDYLHAQTGADATEVESALAANPVVFKIETIDDVLTVLTTRSGLAPVADGRTDMHTFEHRFHKPLPKPIVPAAPRRERARVDPSWASFSISDYAGLEDEEEEFDDIPAPTIGVEDIELILEPLAEATLEIAPDAPVVEAPIAEIPVAAAPIAAAPEVAAPTPTPVVEPKIVSSSPPVAVERPRVTSDRSLVGKDDAAIAEAIIARLPNDPHVAQFGDRWMSEDRVPRLSRGDLRRIKDYIEEQEQPLTDTMLIQDVLNVRPNSAEFELMQFAVNFRLSREHRDFDFVGTSDQRFWSTSNLAPIGTTRRKPNEIGTDYRFLVDETAEQVVAHRSVSTIDHIVSFYEYNLGLLPYDVDMQRLLPAPVNADQRTAVLTFEIPQLYTTYLAELRYPTPNRGGFLLGLDDLYSESLVPGAIIAITATENNGHYKVEFISSKDRSERLLELDDRRAARYNFRPTTFSSEVDDTWLISEDRFPTLGSEKPLDDKIRRRPDAVLEFTFLRIGIDDGNGGKMAAFADLLAAANVERPYSAALLTTTLTQHAHITGDGDTFTYAPGT